MEVICYTITMKICKIHTFIIALEVIIFKWYCLLRRWINPRQFGIYYIKFWLMHFKFPLFNTSSFRSQFSNKKRGTPPLLLSVSVRITASVIDILIRSTWNKLPIWTFTAFGTEYFPWWRPVINAGTLYQLHFTFGTIGWKLGGDHPWIIFVLAHSWLPLPADLFWHLARLLNYWNRVKNVKYWCICLN